MSRNGPCRVAGGGIAVHMLACEAVGAEEVRIYSCRQGPGADSSAGADGLQSMTALGAMNSHTDPCFQRPVVATHRACTAPQTLQGIRRQPTPDSQPAADCLPSYRPALRAVSRPKPRPRTTTRMRQRWRASTALSTSQSPIRSIRLGHRTRRRLGAATRAMLSSRAPGASPPRLAVHGLRCNARQRPRRRHPRGTRSTLSACAGSSSRSCRSQA